MLTLGMYNDNKKMFQQSVFIMRPQKELERRTETSLTDEFWTAMAADRKPRLTGPPDHFAEMPNLIEYIAE